MLPGVMPQRPMITIHRAKLLIATFRSLSVHLVADSSILCGMKHLEGAAAQASTTRHRTSAQLRPLTCAIPRQALKPRLLAQVTGAVHSWKASTVPSFNVHILARHIHHLAIELSQARSQSTCKPRARECPCHGQVTCQHTEAGRRNSCGSEPRNHSAQDCHKNCQVVVLVAGLTGQIGSTLHMIPIPGSIRTHLSILRWRHQLFSLQRLEPCHWIASCLVSILGILLRRHADFLLGCCFHDPTRTGKGVGTQNSLRQNGYCASCTCHCQHV